MTSDNDAHEGRDARRRGVSPRLVLLIVLLVVAAGAAYVAYLLLGGDGAPGPVDTERSTEATETAALTDAFPRGESPPLANPLAIAGTETTLYVAESDAGVVRVFDLEGEDVGSIRVPLADGVDNAYPASVAVVDEDTLAVVDTAGTRVVLLSTDLERDDVLLAVVGCADLSCTPVQPTAVASDGRTLLVADAGTGTVKRFTLTGEFIDEFGDDLEPPLTYAGGIAAGSGRVWVSDSNAARVLMLEAGDESSLGTLQGDLQLPRGVAVDEAGGRVYVADRFGDAIEVFDLSGAHVETIESLQLADESVQVPLGMPNDVMLLSDRLYVVSSTTGRILVTDVR